MTDPSPRQQNRRAKERRILDAALQVFSSTGYSASSMDAIAAAASVSKPTLYDYFGSKEQLFAAVLLQKRDEMLEVFATPLSGAMVKDLHSFAWLYADTVMRPDMLSLARLIISEAQRFPEIGRAYQTSGPDRVLGGIADYLLAQRAAGRLVFEDVELAAQDLWGLILSAPRTQAFYMPENLPGSADLARHIHNGLRVFLRAYSSTPNEDVAKLQELSGARRG